MQADDYYLRIGSAKDIQNPQDRRLYRFLEMVPALFSWGSIALAFLGSWLFPVWTSFFIIAFVLFWFFRSLYFFFHLRTGYKKMKENEATDWIAKLNELPRGSYRVSVASWSDLYHLIILPTYKEPLEIVRESIRALTRVDYPKEKMIVVLALEERAGEDARLVGEEMKREFAPSFFKFLVTVHPADIEGELAGKGSNETWATIMAKEEVIDPPGIPYERVITTSLDIDTVVFPKYFACLTHAYCVSPAPTRTSYQPVPLFLNNVWEAPSISRIFSFSSTFWHTMNQERPERLWTFSSHSMSFQALVDIGFKQTNVVSDDSRVFWQCFFRYDGNYKVHPLHFPLSMDVTAAPTFWKTIGNIYRQQRRWAYGAGEVAFVFYNLVKRKESIPFSKYMYLVVEMVEGHWSWASASILIFILGWLPIFFGGDQFSQSLLSYNLPRVTSYILTASMIGMLWSIYMSMLLLPRRREKEPFFTWIFFLLQWFLLPFSMLLTSVPALDAQTRLFFGKYMGFWVTPKFRTSAKIAEGARNNNSSRAGTQPA